MQVDIAERVIPAKVRWIFVIASGRSGSSGGTIASGSNTGSCCIIAGAIVEIVDVAIVSLDLVINVVGAASRTERARVFIALTTVARQ